MAETSFDAVAGTLNSKIKFFPDVTNALHTFNSPGQSWIATEDCTFIGEIWSSGTDAKLYINDVLVAANAIPAGLLVKKGWKVSTRSDGGNYNATMVGLTT